MADEKKVVSKKFLGFVGALLMAIGVSIFMDGLMAPVVNTLYAGIGIFFTLAGVVMFVCSNESKPLIKAIFAITLVGSISFILRVDFDNFRIAYLIISIAVLVLSVIVLILASMKKKKSDNHSSNEEN